MECYGAPPPGLRPADLHGHLIVVEGPDGVGRSTQIQMLTEWLEGEGHAVTSVGLSRSSLMAPELAAAKDGHELRPYPMALFYAADLFDQLENHVVPALRAGMVVLADRYVHTLIARAVVRGIDQGRMMRVFEGAIRPSIVFALEAKPRHLVERMLHKYGQLDYWEAGMDMGISTDWYTSFVTYQKRVRRVWKDMAPTHPYTAVDANRSIDAIQARLQQAVAGAMRPAP